MSIKITAAVLVATMLVAGCQSNESGTSLETRDNIARHFNIDGVEVVRTSGEFRSILDHPGSCVTDKEILAAQFVRLHTELMVTGLTCPAAYRDPGLFDRYQRFTVNHQSLLRDGQDVIGRFLARLRPGNRARLYDTYRTQLANYEGQLVMTMTASEYCREQYGRFYVLADLDQTALDNYLNAALETYRDAYQQCGSADLTPQSLINQG